MRVTTRVMIGSFIAPRRRASLATSSGTPSISNTIRPGFTRAAQNSTEPLPLPIRTSVGFLETGRSGKIRIHTALALHLAGDRAAGRFDLASSDALGFGRLQGILAESQLGTALGNAMDTALVSLAELGLLRLQHNE